jgi:hypothetical protein
MFIYKINIQVWKLVNYISDILIDRHIDSDQWELCIVWATHISFLDVLQFLLSLEGLPAFYIFGCI